MKKNLLLMTAFALAVAGNSFAYEPGDYAYTTTQRFKVTGENLVQNGNFANGRTGWYGEIKEGEINADVWSIVEGVGPNGETVLESQGNSVDGATVVAPLANSWTVESGTAYIVSLDFKAGTAGFTSTITGGSAAGSTAVDVFLNTDGSLVKLASTDEAPVVNVAAAVNYPGEEWKHLVYYVTGDNTATAQNLVLNIQNLPQGTQVTNIEVHAASEVYDVRIAERRLSLVKELMELPEFNIEAAQEAKAQLQGFIETVEGMIASGEFDDASLATDMMNGLEEEFIEPFFAFSSRRMNDRLAGTDNVASLATVGRGGNLPAAYANLDLWGGNWGHVSGADYLQSSIQLGYAHSATYNVFNTNFPAGKYFFIAEIRNANTEKTSWPTNPIFDLETTCKMFVGKDTIEVGPIVGEEFQRYYMIGNIDEDGQFRAGVEWPGVSSGGSFFIKNVEVRALGAADVIEAQIEHIESWVAYKAQWEAATSARTNVKSILANPNYPWGQNELKAADDKYDAFYQTQQAKGWITADGNDAGVATTEELKDWTLYHGIEEYSEPDEEGNVSRLEYQVVRGFQNAYNANVDLNKPLTDFANAIEAAKGTRNTGAYLTGDRDTYKSAILAALSTLNSVRSATTDATREADVETIATAQETLATATAAFIASVKIEPFVDIDFSNQFAEDTSEEAETPYIIQGAKGQMHFTAIADENNSGTNFALGWGEEYLDVLRVGNGTAYVNLGAENLPSDEEALRVTFDIWHGNLSGKNAGVELRNEAGERVAGFYLNRYNGTLAYNDFNDVLTNGGTGMNVLQYATGVGSGSASNAAICADNNRTSYTLVIDYKNKTLQGTMVNPQKGTNEGAAQPFRADIEDQKVVRFALISNYNNQDRRCWFDNLKISKYPLSTVEEDITEQAWLPFATGIAEVNVAKNAANGAIYTLSGVKVSGKSLKPGLYIKNGKKIVIK